MFCPNCGKTNSTEQKFCRSCGLSLEAVTRSVIDQLPAASHDRQLLRRKQLVENTLLTMGGVGLTAFGSIVVWKIVTDIIIARGQVAGGIVAVVFVLGMLVSLLLVVYRQFLIEQTAKHALPAPDQALPAAQTRQLTDPYFEPAVTVTESTTELLVKKSDGA